MAKQYKKPAAAKAQDALGELWPGQSVELLKALHILTRDGALNADSRRKLKQVLHLANLIRPALDGSFADKDRPALADLGAGRPDPGLVLCDLIFGMASGAIVLVRVARQGLIVTSNH